MRYGYAVWLPASNCAQAQASPQLHWVPQEHAFFCATPWQPQSQAVPGQEVQVQRVSTDSFMKILLGGLN
jgi:hypothetical protein